MSRDWLADEYGDLRPEVAQAGERVPGRAPVSGALRAVNRQRRVSWAGWLVALGLLISFAAYWKLQGSAQPSVTARSVIVAAPPPAREATVFGTNVNLRASPGVNARVVDRLQEGQPLAISNYERGWYQVSASAGSKGWVFGAFVRGHRGPVAGPGVVIQPNRFPSGRKLSRDEKVLVEQRLADGQMILLFPDGERGRVSRNSVRLVQ